MIKIRHVTFCTVLSALALQANAWTIFGSREDSLQDQLRAGDKLMLKADAAYEAGKMERAGGYYRRALQKYEALNESDPGFMDGLAAIRIAYCAKQYTNTLAAAEAEAAGAAEAEVAGAAEAASADVSEVGAAGAAEVSKPQALQPPQPQAAQAAQPQAAQAAETADNSVVEPQPPPRPPYNPRNFAHDFAEARMLMEDGNLSEAAAVLIPMLRHDPSNRQVRLLIAIVRTRQGRYDESIVALEDLRGIREDLPVLLALSGAYMGASRYHDALLALDSAIKLNPSDPSAYLNLAWLTLVMPAEPDTLKNAEIYYRQAIRRGAARDRALEARIGFRKW
ncbi:MAG: tetratricopeptide repeat protein [Kiritimatiellae bacterium]|nr:tetratricopeptide repeat protein [Kiritimatiellia bacterium]